MASVSLTQRLRQRTANAIGNDQSWSSLTMTILIATFEAQQDCRLPEFKGSTLRGAFGHSLLAMSGHDNDGSCRMCERQRCAYGYIFEGTASHSGRNPVLPLVITPPLDTKQEYSEGDQITMTLTLIGDAVSWVPTVVWALGRMGWKGLGSGKSPWHLDDVSAMTPNGSPCCLTDSFESIPVISGQDIVTAWPAFDSCDLTFETPVCIRSKGQVLPEIDAVTLIRRINGRLGDLMEAFCGVEVNAPDMRILNDAAEQIQVESSSFQPHSWERFSTRSQQRHNIEGIKGTMRLTNIPMILIPLLILGQFVHVGKSAAFGMGSYRLTQLR